MKHDKISVELKLDDIFFGIVNLYLKKKIPVVQQKPARIYEETFFVFTFFSLSSSTVGRKLSFRRR